MVLALFKELVRNLFPKISLQSFEQVDIFLLQSKIYLLPVAIDWSTKFNNIINMKLYSMIIVLKFMAKKMPD